MATTRTVAKMANNFMVELLLLVNHGMTLISGCQWWAFIYARARPRSAINGYDLFARSAKEEPLGSVKALTGIGEFFYYHFF